MTRNNNQSSVPDKKVPAVTTSAARWGDHPVVSTVLWMLGHDMKKQRNQNPMPQQNNSSSNVLSWKDDHGGHIAEYISAVQVQGNTSCVSGEGSNVENSQPNSGRNDQQQGDRNNVPPGGSILRRGRINNPNGQPGLPGDCSPNYATPSPQWGFYVPITPPTEQEMYSKSVQLLGKLTKH